MGLDLVTIFKRSGDASGVSENFDILEEMRHMAADDRYEYIFSEINNSNDNIPQNFNGLLKPIKKGRIKRIVEKIPGFGPKDDDVIKSSNLIYGKRGDYVISDEFELAREWFINKFFLRQQYDHELVEKYINSELSKLPFNYYNIYTGVSWGLRTIPFYEEIHRNYLNDFDEILNKALIRFFEKYNTDLNYKLEDFKEEVDLNYKLEDFKEEVDLNYKLENFKEEIDLKFWGDWAFANSMKDLFYLNLYPTSESPYDYKNESNLGFIPRFWRSRSYITPNSLDQTRSLYSVFLQLFQLGFFLFNFIFMWGTFKYYITKVDRNDQNNKQVDKRIEFLINIYWFLLISFCFIYTHITIFYI